MVMEITYITIFLIIVTSLILCLHLLKVTNKFKKSKLPPGPWQLPLLGSIHHLAGSYLPHRRFQELSNSFGPLMHLKLGQVSMIVASSPEYAKEILKTHDVEFASRPLFPAIDILSYNGKGLAFGQYGEQWKQLRKLCAVELLSAKRVQSFQCIREQETSNLIQSIYLSSITDNNSVINLGKMLVRMINSMVMRAVIGKKCDDQDMLIEAINEGVLLVAGFDLNDLFPSFSWILSSFNRSKHNVERCHEKTDRILENIVEEHRERKKIGTGKAEEDFVDVLLRLQGENDVQNDLSNDSIKALILDMVGGGTETTSTTLQWMMSELLKNPQIMKKAQLEVRDALKGKAKITESDVKGFNYLQLLIKETLRLHPPVPLLVPRECRKKCEIKGYEIPAKSRVVVNAWAIGRDPKYWEDAEKFKPERFDESAIDFKGSDFEFLPFGAGRRMCPGMNYGMAAMELPLAQLLYYFDWELPVDPHTKSTSLDMSESFGLTARMKSDLLLCAKIAHVPNLMLQ